MRHLTFRRLNTAGALTASAAALTLLAASPALAAQTVTVNDAVESSKVAYVDITKVVLTADADSLDYKVTTRGTPSGSAIFDLTATNQRNNCTVTISTYDGGGFVSTACPGDIYDYRETNDSLSGKTLTSSLPYSALNMKGLHKGDTLTLKTMEGYIPEGGSSAEYDTANVNGKTIKVG